MLPRIRVTGDYIHFFTDEEKYREKWDRNFKLSETKMREVLTTLGFWMRMISLVVFIGQLIVSMWMAAWSWPLFGTLLVVFVLGILVQYAGEDGWFE